MIAVMDLNNVTIAIPAFRRGKYHPSTVASALRCPGATGSLEEVV